MAGVPHLLHTVIDGPDVRALAEFYRELLGLRYRPGDEPEASDEVPDWLVLTYPDGRRALAFQQSPDHVAPTWPLPGVPQQLHLDMTVADPDELDEQHARVLALGGRMLYDRSDDPQEPLRAYADPAGHPFCIFVAPQSAPEVAPEE
ncbi:VOC family protein [Epidermidibacterium keratini]|uniref:VOC family protein n=1 Tax=Epidermidibacterium keratini TaxID=1891644 RepID=A0A7L4YP51_9ACTN|nr:VOC family protein [Epidermidibacterium keratini]QHC01061.1 VOC family protein [Epidermidibacterium keratini]